MTVRILGIDPGLHITGYGCVEVAPGNAHPTLVEAGVLRLDATASLAHRVAQLHADITEVIGEVRPTVIAVEKLFAHYRHPRTAVLMGHARGVVLLAAEHGSLRIIELAATEVKKAITGHGHASKAQMQYAVQAQCGLAEPPTPPDVADAIAIALCAARRLPNHAE